MNPDVFITMAFAGVVALMALATLVFVVPKLLRDDARAQSREGETGSGAAVAAAGRISGRRRRTTESADR
jgi:hypothetical protein